MSVRAQLRLFTIPAILAATACATHQSANAPREGSVPAGAAPACCLAEGRLIGERHRVAGFDSRRFTHEQLWNALTPILASPVFRVEEIGRSIHGREIRAITYGNGPTRVLLWSQMHGDESTATMSLVDIMAWMASSGSDPLRDRLRNSLTITMVPMLNPDGAERFQRENAAGIDINRDARRQTQPEARALKGLRDRIEPAFGFNLHDQGPRHLVGPHGPVATIALLAPASEITAGWNETRTRAAHVAAVIASVLQREIPGRISRYDDTFTPRAFGDLMQQWGTSTVLIESGALEGDPEKQRIRALNVTGILSALDAIATRSWAQVDRAAYDGLPMNSSANTDLLVLGGRLVMPGVEPLLLDLAIRYDDLLAPSDGRLREVGDLADVTARDTIDARGLFLHPAPSMLEGTPPRQWLRTGGVVELVIRRGASPESAEVRRLSSPR